MRPDSRRRPRRRLQRDPRAALPLFAGRDLDPDEHDAVQRHLDDCPACSLSLAPWIDLRGTLAAERAARSACPAPRSGETSGPRLQEEGLLRPQPAAALPAAASAPRAVFRALAVAAAVVLAVVLSRPADQGASPFADGGGASQDLALGPVPREAAAPEQLGSPGPPVQAPPRRPSPSPSSRRRSPRPRPRRPVAFDPLPRGTAASSRTRWSPAHPAPASGSRELRRDDAHRRSVSRRGSRTSGALGSRRHRRGWRAGPRTHRPPSHEVIP